VISLRWEGYIRRAPVFAHGSNRISNRQAVTPAFLAELDQRCPNLRELHVIYADLDSITLRNFPATLEFLGFEGCIVGFDFFGPLNDPNFLPNLTGLDLSYCHNLSSNSRFSIPGILSRQQLTILLLKHCFKISVEHLLEIPVRLPHLHSLNVSHLTIVDGNFIRVLAEKANTLKRLDISFCHAIDTTTISPLATSEICLLERLYLIETGITDEALALLAQHQRQLRYLNVIKTRCTANGITAFNRVNSQCQIEHQSNDVGEKIGGSFWWIKINCGADDGEVAPMEH